MKKPTIKEVRDHFKSVSHVITPGRNYVLPINVEQNGIYESEIIGGAFCERRSGVILYHPMHGYSLGVKYGGLDVVAPRKEYRYCVDLAIDFKFWSAAINLNFHNGFTFEIEFLCFGLYIGRVEVNQK